MKSTFRIFGSDMQFVEVELDPGESAIAEAGSILGGLGDLMDGDS